MGRMEDSIGLLVSDVSRLMRRRFDQSASSIGVTRAQWRTLTAVSRHEGINQGRLADLLEVEPITLCRMIDRLEEAGHVERQRDPADRRAWRIVLTERSRPLLDQLRLIADRVIGDALDGMDNAETHALVASLNRIRGNLGEVDMKEVAHG